jgi:GT2 family glycosyltransferase
MTVAGVLVTGSPAPAADVPPADRPLVSVIVVTYGSGRIAIDTLRSLVRSIGDIDYEVVVVDNLHPRQPERTARELALFTRGVRLVRPGRNLGFAGGCEFGVLHSRGDVLAFANPDITFPTGWLARLLAALDERPSPAIVAPVLVDPDGSVQEAGSTIDWEGSTTRLRSAPGTAVFPVESQSAACWLMRRSDHELVGGFDPAYHPAYFEDVDLALRVCAFGGTVAVHGEVRVVHHTGTGTPDAAPPAHANKATLRATWPQLRWTQPGRPADLATFHRP